MGWIGKTENQHGCAQKSHGDGGSVSRRQFSFRKYERLRSRQEFQLALRYGSRRHTEHFTVILRPNNMRYSRLGLTVSKKVGSAVKRNRVKRRLREFFRLHKHQLPPSHDLVLIAKKGASALGYQEVCEELAPVLLEENGQ